mgnify:FL=1
MLLSQLEAQRTKSAKEEEGGGSRMAVKWIVTDMDGTLLNERDQITETAREYLIA